MDFNILLHKELYNKKSKEQLIDKLKSEDFDRVTCSFYKYVPLKNLNDLRNKCENMENFVNGSCSEIASYLKEII